MALSCVLLSPECRWSLEENGEKRFMSLALWRFWHSTMTDGPLMWCGRSRPLSPFNPGSLVCHERGHYDFRTVVCCVSEPLASCESQVSLLGLWTSTSPLTQLNKTKALVSSKKWRPFVPYMSAAFVLGFNQVKGHPDWTQIVLFFRGGEIDCRRIFFSFVWLKSLVFSPQRHQLVLQPPGNLYSYVAAAHHQ